MKAASLPNMEIMMLRYVATDDPAQLLHVTLQLLDDAGLTEHFVLVGGAAIRAYVSTRKVRDIDVCLKERRDIDLLRLRVSQSNDFTITRGSIPILHHLLGNVDIIG